MFYELVYFVSFKVGEKDRDALSDQVNNLIIDLGGKILNKNILGKIELAQPIKKEKIVFGLVIYFELEPEQLKKLEQRLKGLNGILRGQFFRSQGGTNRPVFKQAEKQKTKVHNQGSKKKDNLDI